MVPAERIGTVIAKRRHVLGLSQQELAQRIGVSRDAVSAWERDKHFPHRHLGKLEQVLGISLAANGTGPALPTDPVERQLYDLAVVDGGAEGAWAVVGEYRRRVRRRAG